MENVNKIQLYHKASVLKLIQGKLVKSDNNKKWKLQCE